MSFSLKVLSVPLAVAAIIILFSANIKAQVSSSGTGCWSQTNYMRCTVCKNGEQNITCPAGERIQIISALYGRFQSQSLFCPAAATDSSNCNGSEGVTEILRLCQDKTRCFIPKSLDSAVFVDPCSGVDKYIDINFTCSIPRETPTAETLAHLTSNSAKDPENLENIIEEISQNHPETNGSSYNNGDTQLHIVVTKIDEKTYNSILELGSSHIDFTLQTNNVSRIVATVFVYKVNATDIAQTQLADAGSIAITRYIAVENTTYIVIIGWDANSFLRSTNDTTGNNQLPGNVNFAMRPTSPESVCKKVEEQKKNKSNLMVRKLEPICLFIDGSTKKHSDEGCVTSIDDVTGDVTCKCNHLTIFTVLLAVETIAIPSGVKITSYTTEAASIVFLLATIVILCIHRRGDDRILVQINLSVALLLFHAVNISHDFAVLHEAPCVAFTVTTHYLLLCVGMWFLVEGVRLVMATSFPYAFEGQDPETRFKVFLVVGWVVPAILVGTAVGVGFSHDIYMKPQPYFKQCHNFQNQSFPIPKYDRCWMAPGTPIFYASVVAPLALVLFTNFIIILKTTHVMFNMNGMQNRDVLPGVENALRAAKSFLLLLVMLGGTWSLAFFTGIGNEISNEVFMYINGVVNGSQGIVVFLLYCVMNHVIRQEILPCKSQANAGSEQRGDTTGTGASHQR